MICSKCGYNVPDDMHFCGVCGSDVPSQSQENQIPVQEFNAPMPDNSLQPPASDPNDKPDSLVNAMSFFYPIFGFILYFVDREKRPVHAKAALKWAIISSVCYVVFFALYFAGVFAFAMFAGFAEAGMLI